MKRVSLVAALLVVLAGTSLAPGVAAAAAGDPPPVYAHYYIWFESSSWNRAKIDYPLAGRYSSDESRIMLKHIRMAKASGIDGFFVSWKATEPLRERLAKLAAIARRERFKLGIVYQGLDFERRPLPASRVRLDLERFLDEHGRETVFQFRAKPLVAWSGTWKFSRREIASVTGPLRDRMRILGTEKNVRDYEAKADLFDGDLYYWSSVNPDTYPTFGRKLKEMSDSVHSRNGVWVAPAAPGFDARLVGGTKTVPRKDGETLRRQMDAALQSSPDIVGLISWNEFSENTHIEPSRKHGGHSLDVLSDILGAPGPQGELDSSAPGGRGGPSNLVAPLVGLLVLAAGGVMVWRRRRDRDNDDPRGEIDASRPPDAARQEGEPLRR